MNIIQLAQLNHLRIIQLAQLNHLWKIICSEHTPSFGYQNQKCLRALRHYVVIILILRRLFMLHFKSSASGYNNEK